MTVQCILDAKGKGAAHIAPDATIAQVLQSLESQNVDALVVSCDGSSVDGIISEHDVVLGLKKFGSDLLGKPVRDLMTAKVIPAHQVTAWKALQRSWFPSMCDICLL